MATKKEQAIELYKQLLTKDPNPSTGVVMKLFQDKLDMTVAGSRTYASTVKSIVMGNTTPSSPSPKTIKTPKASTSDAPIIETEKATDKRQLYSKCYFKDDEVVMSSSHYDKQDALDFTPKTKEFKRRVEGLDSFTIIGVPADFETVTHIKKTYKIIG